MSDNKNVGIQPASEYEIAQNIAANNFTYDKNYYGSYEALALKQGFVLGANTSLQFSEDRLMMLIEAVQAGRKWGQAERDD
jgi:hypothetical protein